MAPKPWMCGGGGSFDIGSDDWDRTIGPTRKRSGPFRISHCDREQFGTSSVSTLRDGGRFAAMP